MSRKFTLASTGIALLLIMGSCEKITTPSASQSDEVFLTGALQSSGSLVEGQYIVVLKEGTISLGKSKAAVSGLAARIMADNAVTEGTVELVYTHALAGFMARMSARDAIKLEADPRVKYVEQDRVIALAPPPGKGKPPKDDGGGETTQVIPWGIERVGGATNASGSEHKAWVIDTGIDLKHADLIVDVGLSANFVTRGKDSPKDGHGHGTHVAGTIAARNNDIDVVGVAAGATLVAVRVLDNSGSGFYSWVIAGVNYVAEKASDGDVANMSLGGPPSQALDDAVLGAASTGNTAGTGVIFSLAAGNSGDDANNYSPARVEHGNVYTNCLIYWSNFGTAIEFAAPGVGILSTKKGGGTTTMSGTSMSAPHVAGLLLLGNVNSDGQVCLGSDPDGDIGRDPIAHN